MPPDLPPLITPGHLGHAVPDRVQVSVFADGPRALGDTKAITAHATHFFQSKPGAKPFLDADDPQGPGYTWKEGQVTYRQHIERSFSLTVIFNPQRLAPSRLDAAGPRGRHANTVLPLLAEGYDWTSLRQGMAEDITDIVARAKARYATLVPQAFGVLVNGEVQANWSVLELDYDFAVAPEVISTYSRAFSKLVKVADEAKGLSGALRKGEAFAIYGKDQITRFEIRITGKRIKEVAGTQRVPDSVPGVLRVLDALEARYSPVWAEIERHRQPGSPAALGQWFSSLPRVRDRDALDRVARQLAKTGRIRVGPKNRTVLTALQRRGQVENPRITTRVRGYRITTPGNDQVWQHWGDRV